MRNKSIALGLVASALLAPSLLSAGGGGTTTWCVFFTNFCDALTLDVNIDTSEVTGTWENWDCLGATSQMSGSVQPGNAQVRAICDTPDCPNASRYMFIVKGANKVFDLILDDGAGNPLRIQANQSYGLRMGACPVSELAGSEASWGSLN